MTTANILIRRRTRFSRAIIPLFFLPLVFSLTGWRIAAPLFEHALALVGWGLIGLGIAGRMWSGSYICGHKNKRLSTDGPYSISRNPLYFFSFLGGLGVAFLTETLTFPLLFSVVFLSYYSAVIRKEENKLQDLHGAVFKLYCDKTPRFWPNFRLYSEASDYVVSAKLLRKHCGDIPWFILAGAMVEFIEELHVSGYLPTFYNIF